MTRPLTQRSLVLGFHPSTRGFGWAVFENPVALHSFGAHHAQGDRNASCMKKVAWLLDRLEPDVLVIEAFDDESSRRKDRIRRLCLEVVSLAAERNAELAVVTRANVLEFFGTAGAHSRGAIAETLGKSFPALAPQLPKKREQWDSERARMAVFAAAAAVLTHYHNEAAAFLDEMRNAA